jgi:hypothetical protein
MALIFALLLLLCSFNCLLTVSATAAAGFLTDADMGDDERSNNDIVST